MMNVNNISIAIVGLGYVGLPLLTLFSRYYRCWGIDTNPSRLDVIREQAICGLIDIGDSNLTSSFKDIGSCNFYIVSVPTPTHVDNTPDLSLLEEACIQVGAILRKGDIVVFESTVYPGATEEVCIPMLEEYSNLVCNTDFSVGYSPERINVGDLEHSIHNTPKIISASNAEALGIIEKVYGSVLSSNRVCASSIKVAEAAKMYENVQRDVLIGLANEYADYCRQEGIDINEVTRCAATKWNFAKVSPGLVGGHCIGVDPYYLLDRSNQLCISLPLIAQSRSTNEKKAINVKDRIVVQMSNAAKKLPSAKLLLLGFSYKKDCADIRNTKVAEIIKLLLAEGVSVECYDPLVDIEDVNKQYGISLLPDIPDLALFDLVIIMVNHKIFERLMIDEKYDKKVTHLSNFL